MGLRKSHLVKNSWVHQILEEIFFNLRTYICIFSLKQWRVPLCSLLFPSNAKGT